MNKCIAMFKGQSQYDSLIIFLNEIASGFRNLGYEVDIIDLTDENVFKYLGDIVGKNYDFTFSFQGGINTLKLDNGDVYLNLISNKHITYIVDHPTYHLQRLQQPVNNLTVLCVDNDASNLVKTFPAVRESYFMPLAGIKGSTNKPMSKREIDVLFTGTYSKPESVKSEFLKCSENLQIFFNEVSDYLISNVHETIDGALKRYLEALNIPIDNDVKYIEYIPIGSSIDSYVRSYFRDKIIRLLVDSGVKVHVYGNGWDAFECNKSENLIIHEPLNYMKILEVMENSKIVLNIMPWFKDGFHDRIPCAMLNGAVCVTDSSKYIDKEFKDNEDIVLYSLEKLDELPNTIKNIIQNEELMEGIASRGYDNAAKNHHWMNRVLEIEKIMTN
jgi:glycosyltransferase involved in cell wall biosynthesis